MFRVEIDFPENLEALYTNRLILQLRRQIKPLRQGHFVYSMLSDKPQTRAKHSLQMPPKPKPLPHEPTYDTEEI
jgi:hypothetical protein